MKKQAESIYARHSKRCFDSSFEDSRDLHAKILEAESKYLPPKKRQPWFFIVLDKKDDIRCVADIMDNKYLGKG